MKIAAAQKGDSSLFTDLSTKPFLPDWKFLPICHICSIDIGSKNFSIRIEKRSIDGTCIQTLHMERFQIDSEVKTLKMSTQKGVYNRLTEYLDDLFEILDKCHLIIVERQMAQNYFSTRIMQHVLTYCMIKLYDKLPYPQLVELDSKVKYKCLNAPKEFDTKHKKKWGITHAITLLEQRLDHIGLDIIDRERKKDDLADTIIQIEGFYALMRLKLTVPLNDPLLDTEKNGKPIKSNNIIVNPGLIRLLQSRK